MTGGDWPYPLCWGGGVLGTGLPHIVLVQMAEAHKQGGRWGPKHTAEECHLSSARYGRQ